MESEFDSALSCPICYEDYGVPKALPCLHTFCLRCLLKIPAEGDSTITCPVCSVVHRLPPNGVEGFRTNFALNDVVRDLKSPKFREVMSRKYKCEEVEDIVKQEVDNLKHLVEVVHAPLLQSIISLKRGSKQQHENRTKLAAELYDHIIAHALQEKEKHLKNIKRSGAGTMKYFDDVQNEILKEKGSIESFCVNAEGKTFTQLEKMDLNAFLVDATAYNRSGRRIATDHSHLMWNDVDVVEGKEQVRLVHSSLGDVIRVHANTRSHRPRIGTMESDKKKLMIDQRTRSKSEPNPDAIKAACLPNVRNSKKLSDPVRNVVDSVLHMFRNNGPNRENGERKSEMKRTADFTPKRSLHHATPSAKRSLFSDPPPYKNIQMRRSMSNEEPMVSRSEQKTLSAPQRTNSSKSTSSGNSHSSGTSSIPGPPKPPRSPNPSSLQSPCGIAITTDDRLLIAERNSGRVRLMHPRSVRVHRIIHPFMGHVDEAKAHALFDLTVLPNEDIAVTDSSVKKVIFLQKFNNYAAPQRLWMPHDMVPRGITSDSSCIYVGDAGNGCIQVYTHTGKHCSSIELDHLTADRSPAVSEVCPQSIAVSPNGHILVSDIINRCLYLVLRTGEISRHPMRFTPYNGIRFSALPTKAVPRGVCWLDDRRAFVVEDSCQEILLINISMELLKVIKRQEFSSLQGMTIDSAARVLVTDIGNNSVHVILPSDYSMKGRDKAPAKRSKSLTREEPLDTLV